MGRRLLILAVFLVAGAVVNVAVAWGCALCVDPVVGGTLEFASATTTTEHWTLAVMSRGGARFIQSSRNRGPHDPVKAADLLRLPYWAKLATPRAEYASGAHDFEMILVESRGWPLQALRCEVIPRGGPLLFGVLGAIETPWQWKVVSRPRSLPLLPVWPGFIANTLGYAVVLWLLIPGPFALRRWVRRRRGLCPKCAYPVGESAVCTECGGELAT